MAVANTLDYDMPTITAVKKFYCIGPLKDVPSIWPYEAMFPSLLSDTQYRQHILLTAFTLLILI
jgi:hypothetical protein